MNSWIHDDFMFIVVKPYSWDNEGLETWTIYCQGTFVSGRMTYIPEHQTNDGKAIVIYKGKTASDYRLSDDSYKHLKLWLDKKMNRLLYRIRHTKSLGNKLLDVGFTKKVLNNGKTKK